jgi:hypothetical protein
MCRCLIFKDTNSAHHIKAGELFHHPVPSHRFLYVGRDLTLLGFLNSALKDCLVVRSLGGSDARLLIESSINYSLLLLDDELLDMRGIDLAQFARRLAHREQTPIVILSASEACCAEGGLLFEKLYDYDSIVETITRLLCGQTRP